MEHLLGCHGEWVLLAQALQTLPFLGPMVQPFLAPVLTLFSASGSQQGGEG